jgi:hypothetical protein
MRYRFIDEVVAVRLEDPARIEVAKTFPRGDDALSGPLGPDRVPSSLLLELQAMTTGHLLFQRLEQRRLPLLLKVEECRFEGWARPDVRLRATAELRGIVDNADGSSVAEANAEVFDGDRRLAGSRLLFVCVPLPPGQCARLDISS